MGASGIVLKMRKHDKPEYGGWFYRYCCGRETKRGGERELAVVSAVSAVDKRPNSRLVCLL